MLFPILLAILGFPLLNEQKDEVRKFQIIRISSRGLTAPKDYKFIRSWIILAIGLWWWVNDDFFAELFDLWEEECVWVVAELIKILILSTLLYFIHNWYGYLGIWRLSYYFIYFQCLIFFQSIWHKRLSSCHHQSDFIIIGKMQILSKYIRH